MKTRPILLNSLSRNDLYPIVYALNSMTDLRVREQLRSLVDAWMKSGPDLQKMFRRAKTQQGHALHEAFQDVIAFAYVPQTGSGRADVAVRFNFGHCVKTVRSQGDPKEATDECRALQLFAWLTLNPHCALLAGPCTRSRCSKYFVRGRRHQEYCSRNCANHARIEAIWQKDRQKKIDRVEHWLGRWAAATTTEPWKTWVARNAKVDVKFLTRVENKGEITAPSRIARV